eukprot:TRINITY_DN3773_c1_g2_i3.p1 TRINITY_DN3773_c1_g2~~TRINITY_DN3773_c1_g2_i3.p1  ORF type:complete len:542 (+),score=88.19 TRINITY_DN3773_c1_g2_i3:2201-3826(+)
MESDPLAASTPVLASPPSLSKAVMKIGMDVRVKGSLVGQGSALKGRTGKVVKLDMDEGRVTVEFGNGEQRTLPCTTLRAALPEEMVEENKKDVREGTEEEEEEEEVEIEPVVNEDTLVSELKIPKTSSLYTGSAENDTKTKPPSPVPQQGRKLSRRDQFKHKKNLTLSTHTVVFKDPTSGNEISLKPANGKCGGLSYKVNGESRPDVRTVKYDVAAQKLRFIDINKSVTLPEDGVEKLVETIRKLLDECNVWHNIRRPKQPPVSCTLRTTPGRITFKYEKGGVLTVSDKRDKKICSVRDLKFDSSRCTLIDGRGGVWKLSRDDPADIIVNQLYSLCEITRVPHKLHRVKRKGKIWVKPATRYALKAIAIKNMRSGGRFADIKLLKEITRWCGMYDTDPLHILVVLWGFSDVIESRHVRVSKGVHATPADIHTKLSTDKRWLEARDSDFTWDCQAVYYHGCSDINAEGFTPRPLLPTYPLVTQGYVEGSGDALHIISTAASEKLALFKSKARRISLSSIKSKDCSGISSRDGKELTRECVVM